MKKLLFLTLILASANCFAQLPLPCHSACQSNAQRAYMKQSLDSAKKIWYAEFLLDAKKADTAQYKTLPVISKENLAQVNVLTATIKGLRDTINMLSPVPQDTSWRKEIRDLKADNAKQAAAVQELTTQLVELKAWADKLKVKQYVIDFK